MNEPDRSPLFQADVPEPLRGNVLMGCGLVLVLNATVAIVLLLLAGAGQPLPFVLLGLVQLLYLVPIGLRLRGMGHHATLQGVIIGAALTLVWTAGCFALLGPALVRTE
jgi:hypothetical protein